MREDGKLHVIIATRIFPPEIAAAAFRLRSLAEEVVAMGGIVHVLTSRAPKSEGPDLPTHGAIVSRFPVLRDRSGNIRGYFQYLSFDLPLFFRLILRQADVIVAEPPPTTGAVVAMISMCRRRPFVYYAADIWTDAIASTSAPKIVEKLMRKVESFVLRRAAAVLAVSEEVADRVREFGAMRVHMVGNGVDTSIFSPRPSPADIVNDDEVFVYAGTMSEWQGAEVFLEAFALIADEAPSAHLHFFGQGSRQATMRARAREISQDRIRFHGLVSAHNTASWLRNATAALVSITPDQGYDFAKPTKLYAAAGCGTPVIFAGNGVAKELVNSELLGVAVPHSAESVAEAMRQLLGEHRTGVTSNRRNSRAKWAQDHASLNAVGMKAAHVVFSVATGRKKLQ